MAMFYKCTGSVIHAMWLAEPLAFQIDKTIEKRATNEAHFNSNRPPTCVEGRLEWCWENMNPVPTRSLKVTKKGHN